MTDVFKKFEESEKLRSSSDDGLLRFFGIEISKEDGGISVTTRNSQRTTTENILRAVVSSPYGSSGGWWDRGRTVYLPHESVQNTRAILIEWCKEVPRT